MAGRKSSAAINAQKKAAEAALKFQQQQDRLLELAAEFFAIPEKNGVSDLEKQIEDLEVKIQQLREKINQQQESSQLEQATVVVRMKTEGIAVAEIAQRLAISSSEARRLLKMAPQQSEESSTNDSEDSPSDTAV